MAGQLSYYDILGVLPGAAADDVQQSYDARARVLAPELIAGAPSRVVAAANRASVALETALRTLIDPASRARYDIQTGLRQIGGGLDRTVPVPSEDGHADGGWPTVGADRGVAVAGALSALADWLAPRPASARRTTVPDARGLFVGSARRLLLGAGLRVDVKQLTQDPMPVEGLVIDQSPQAGARARRSDLVTVQVWHPARRPRRSA
jgi:curved DNA-binding protein CbpA